MRRLLWAHGVMARRRKSCHEASGGSIVQCLHNCCGGCCCGVVLCVLQEAHMLPCTHI